MFPREVVEPRPKHIKMSYLKSNRGYCTQTCLKRTTLLWWSQLNVIIIWTIMKFVEKLHLILDKEWWHSLQSTSIVCNIRIINFNFVITKLDWNYNKNKFSLWQKSSYETKDLLFLFFLILFKSRNIFQSHQTRVGVMTWEKKSNFKTSIFKWTVTAKIR